MITYDEYESLIVERLTMDGVDVSPLPLQEVLNEPKVAHKPRIYVIFTGSTFEDTSRLGEFTQNEPLTFEIYIQARTRAGAGGIFEVAEEAIQRLLKWRPPGANRKISFKSFGYLAGVQNNWQYTLQFGFPRTRIAREEKEDIVLIKKITFQNASNNDDKISIE